MNSYYLSKRKLYKLLYIVSLLVVTFIVFEISFRPPIALCTDKRVILDHKLVEPEVTEKLYGALEEFSTVSENMEETFLFADDKKKREDSEKLKLVIDFFKDDLKNEVKLFQDRPPTPNFELVIRALLLWEEETLYKKNHPNQNLWGNLGHFKSEAYANVNLGIPKCNLFIAEILNQALCEVSQYRLLIFQKKFPYIRTPPWKWLPEIPSYWSYRRRKIPNFKVRENGKQRFGDIWASDEHIGIYLGNYFDKKLYISARTFGIEIKFIPDNITGTYRYYAKSSS